MNYVHIKVYTICTEIYLIFACNKFRKDGNCIKLSNIILLQKIYMEIKGYTMFL